jgi:hypothetical protein
VEIAVGELLLMPGHLLLNGQDVAHIEQVIA